jgi:hypothetical protein
MSQLLFGCSMLLVHAQDMASEDTTSRLLALPDHCLLAVMQCCADDTRSMISAATAHSRLQWAAVQALSSVSARRLDQARIDSVLLYLAKHGQHVRSLALRGLHPTMHLPELPLSLTKLDSLQLEFMELQLQPGSGAQGVLRAVFPLTRLELSKCSLLDGAQGLAAALVQLPDLEHLKVTEDMLAVCPQAFPTDVLPHLQKLTCLLLGDVGSPNGSIKPRAFVHPLQALTRLVDLQLGLPVVQTGFVTADALSGAAQLTRLVLSHQGLTRTNWLASRSCSTCP